MFGLMLGVTSNSGEGRLSNCSKVTVAKWGAREDMQYVCPAHQVTHRYAQALLATKGLMRHRRSMV